MIHIQRYAVSLWSYQSCEPGESPRYLHKETMATTHVQAIHNVMRQAGVASAHRAKVVTLRTNECQQVKHVTVENAAQAIQERLL